MRLELTGRHVDITPGLRRLVDSKLTKLERLLNDRAVSAQCVLTLEKHRHCAELTLHARGERFLHATTAADGWPAAVHSTIAKLTQQAQKVKGKLDSRKRRGGRVTEAAPLVAGVAAPAPSRTRVRTPHLVQSTRQPVKPMSIADATREVESSGEGVVIFRDLETTSISVLYRRRNGELRLVETEA
jgi:putative sigma-54 modulation protein